MAGVVARADDGGRTRFVGDYGGLLAVLGLVWVGGRFVTSWGGEDVVVWDGF